MPATVLIADADPDRLDLISALLTEEGFQTVAVRDGVAALHSLRAGRSALAIIDLSLPVMDGRELIERIRQEPGPPLPIIALSAARSADTSDPIEADASLTRPVDLEELLEHVIYLTSQQPGPPASKDTDDLSLLSAMPSLVEARQPARARPS